ncbi:hypothetical protein [Bradyrhizobium genosp. P]|uniref:hypothetical protein n=1 Tax=Bradyrhizobium genosp. P TaxID=83641 RepID=UPI003CF70F97
MLMPIEGKKATKEMATKKSSPKAQRKSARAAAGAFRPRVHEGRTLAAYFGVALHTVAFIHLPARRA